MSHPRSKFLDPCEWNPQKNAPAYIGDEHAAAELIVGAKGEWRLCACCAELPSFARFKVRKLLCIESRQGGS